MISPPIHSVSNNSWSFNTIHGTSTIPIRPKAAYSKIVVVIEIRITLILKLDESSQIAVNAKLPPAMTDIQRSACVGIETKLRSKDIDCCLKP